MFALGVARGTGWQNLGAYVNLGAYYLVGIPVALILGFVLDLRGKGLWMGLTSGAVVQSALTFTITYFTDWKRKVVNVNVYFSFKTCIVYPRSLESEFDHSVLNQ